MKKEVSIALAAAMMTMVGTAAQAKKKVAMEKCYGVVKAGKNDCASSYGQSCTGTSRADGDPLAYVMVPKGLCDKLAGGTPQPLKK